MPLRYRILLFCAASLLFIGCDRVTKDLAKAHLKDQATLSYLNDAVRLQYVENTGAALNLGDDLSKTASFWLLSIVPLLFLTLLFAYSIRNSRRFGTGKLLSLSLLFSGGIGNIIDRLLFDRHVADFMNIGLGNLRTGIFNVADICVTAGVIGFLLYQHSDRESSASLR